MVLAECVTDVGSEDGFSKAQPSQLAENFLNPKSGVMVELRIRRTLATSPRFSLPFNQSGKVREGSELFYCGLGHQ